MKRSLIAALYFLVSLLTLSCSKVDALFVNGEPVTETRSADEPFEIICMYNNVNVNLIQSNRPRFELTCPKNLIDNVVTEIRNDSLIIRNDKAHINKLFRRLILQKLPDLFLFGHIRE